MLDDVIQVWEQIVFFLQVQQVSCAGVQMGAWHVVVHTHPAAPWSTRTRGFGKRFIRPLLSRPIVGSGFSLRATVLVIGGICQTLNRQGFGKGAWFMVFGDVDEEIFIRAKLVPAKLALSFSSLTLRRELHILQIHAASLAGSSGFRTSHLLNTGCHSLNARTHNNH